MNETVPARSSFPAMHKDCKNGNADIFVQLLPEMKWK